MFRFIQCSDWHLTPPPGSGRPTALKQRLGMISWRLNRHRRHRREVFDAALRIWRQTPVDRFCVVGDLVNFALPAEFRAAAAELTALEKLAPVSLVPGNHDALVRSGTGEQAAHWSRWLRGDAAEAEGLAVWRQGPVAVLGLTSAVATAPFMAWGKVTVGQVAAVEDRLRQLRQDGAFRIVMIHHPPQTGAAGWRRGLHHASALREALRRVGAELVLHGHLHHPVRASLPGPEGPIPVCGTGSASYLARTPGGRCGQFNLFHLAGAPGQWRLTVTDYRHNPLDGEFHATTPQPEACFPSL